MIELAPHNKQGLALASPLIAGSGAVGYADAWPPGISISLFGAIVTPPVSWRARRGHPAPRLAEIPGGFVLSAGDHNPGLRRVLDDHTLDWRRSGTPIILALAGSAPEDWDRLAAHVEDEPGVAGIELHIPEGVRSVDVNTWVSTVRRATTLPLLVKLPAAQSAVLATAARNAGADALVVGTPPRASAPGQSGALVEGPAAGPLTFPFTLYALRALVSLDLGLPIIASGGIAQPEAAALCFEAGAVALQVRSLLWADPAAAMRLAERLIAHDPT